jgi:hypothetical protein
VLLALFFVVCCLCLLVSGLADPSRRTARWLLLAAVMLWAAGSASLHEGSDMSQKRFPDFAEVFFVPAYVALLAFLLVGREVRRGPGVKVWLDTLVICGAVVCVVGSLLASPVGAVFGTEGPALLLKLFYPLLNLALVLLVLGQVLLGVRGRGRDTAMLLASLLLLAACDLVYFAALADGRYNANNVTDVLYGVTFALLVTSACTAASPCAVRSRARNRGSLLVTAGGTALLALVLRPAEHGDWFVTGPALLTLVAAGARLVVALREAQGAAEARALSRTDELTGLLNRRAILADVDAPAGRGRAGGPHARGPGRLQGGQRQPRATQPATRSSVSSPSGWSTPCPPAPGCHGSAGTSSPSWSWTTTTSVSPGWHGRSAPSSPSR